MEPGLENETGNINFGDHLLNTNLCKAPSTGAWTLWLLVTNPSIPTFPSNWADICIRETVGKMEREETELDSLRMNKYISRGLPTLQNSGNFPAFCAEQDSEAKQEPCNEVFHYMQNI